MYNVHEYGQGNYRQGFWQMDRYKRWLNRHSYKPFAKGEILLYQGEVPNSVYVIKTGLVKIYNLTHEGDVNTLGFSVPLDILPTSWTFGKTQNALFFYEAALDTEVYVISKYDFQEQLKNNYMQSYMLDHYISTYVSNMIRVNAMQYPRAMDKIIHTLFFLSMRFGKSVTQNNVVLGIKLTQQDIADLIGLTRETTGIELNRLKKQGVLSFSKQIYTINRAKLAKKMGENEFLNINL